MNIKWYRLDLGKVCVCVWGGIGIENVDCRKKELKKSAAHGSKLTGLICFFISSDGKCYL